MNAPSNVRRRGDVHGHRSQPIFTSPSDARGRVDLDALKAAGLNCERHSQALLAKHRAGERAQLATEVLILSLADRHA